MENYDYYEAVKEDVKSYILDNDVNPKNYFDRGDMEQDLSDTLFTEDSVTGNASGSYTFSTYKAEENLAHNFDLLKEALEEFGQGDEPISEFLSRGAEYADVTIRCYCLGSAINEAIDELENEGKIELKFQKDLEDEEEME